MSDCRLVEATFNDCELLYQWANDKEVRKNSFNHHLIVYEDHIKWFEDKLRSDNTTIYIFKNIQESIGMLRLEKIDESTMLINYSIDKKYRGQGYATKLLQTIKKQQVNYILVGKVKKDNIGSIRAFEKAGYFMKEELEYQVFYSKEELKRE